MLQIFPRENNSTEVSHKVSPYFVELNLLIFLYFKTLKMYIVSLYSFPEMRFLSGPGQGNVHLYSGKCLSKLYIYNMITPI